MSPGATVVRRAVTDEVDGYRSSVAGVELESVRAGRGTGPSEIVAALGDRFTFTSSKVGFPMLTRATIADDVIALTHVQSTSRGSRWCEIDLVPGAVMIYGPEAEHAAVNNPGLEFTFAVVACDQLLAYAAGLGVHIRNQPSQMSPISAADPTA